MSVHPEVTEDSVLSGFYDYRRVDPLVFRALDFDNDDVTNAGNPSSWGYHHGPYQSTEAGYDPMFHQPGADIYLQRALSHPQAVQSPRIGISRLNTLVCDVVVGNNDTMCGRTFDNHKNFQAHLRAYHNFYVSQRYYPTLDYREVAAFENAVKLWVRSGGWRGAFYQHEPAFQLNYTGLCWLYAEGMTRIAVENPEFGSKYGYVFHRSDWPEDPLTREFDHKVVDKMFDGTNDKLFDQWQKELDERSGSNSPEKNG